MNNKAILLLRLEGVLQSWGERSKWNERDSASQPTKSGVIGMIACAMGIFRGDEFISEMQNSVEMEVIACKAGVMIADFHTFSGRLHTAKTIALHKKPKEGTKISNRQYLQDAMFLVGLEGETKLIERMKEALLNPVWQIYLGRKCCVPSCPVFYKIYCEYSSLKQILEQEREKLNQEREDKKKCCISQS